MNEPITEISPDEFATDFDRFVHLDEVTAIAAERDELEGRLARVKADRDEAHALLRDIAAALGDPEQDYDDLPASVEALRLQRDYLRDAAKAALSEVIRG